MEAVGDWGREGSAGVDKGRTAARLVVLIINGRRNNVTLQNPGRGSSGK